MSSNDLIYREGYLKEKETLKQLGILSYNQFSKILSADDWATMDRFLNDDKMWEQLVSVSKIFVGEDNGKMIGMAYLVPSGNPTYIYPADWSYIRMVGVNPDYRGKGIAKHLTQICVDFAKQSNEKIVGLHTSELMDAARHIYGSLGFTIDKEIDPIYGMKYWLYKLELT